MKKVVQATMIGTLPPIQGISSYCKELASALQKTVPLEFITFSHFAPSFAYAGKKSIANESFEPAWPNVTIRRTLAWFNPFSWWFAGVRAQGKIVHFHWWSHLLFPAFFTALVAAKMSGKKIVCTVHNIETHEKSWLDAVFSRVFFKGVDHFIVHTEGIKKIFSRAYVVSPQRVHVIPHGVFDFYDNSSTPKQSRKRLNIPAEAKVLLYFGNMRPYKGMEDLIEAFSRLGREENYYLILAGSPWNQEYAREIEERVKGLSSVLLKIAYIPEGEVGDYFQAADVVVLPYRNFTSQSGVGNIALAFEKPLIVSNAGGLSELVLDEKLVFAAKDVTGLIACIRYVFSSPTQLKKLGKDSELLKKKYSWSEIAIRTKEVYDTICPTFSHS